MSNYKRNRAWLAALAVSLMLSGTVLGNMNLIVNGSFENASQGYTAPTGTYTTLTATSTAIEGWTVTEGSVDWIRTYWTASDGLRSIDLSGNVAGRMVSQSVNTVAGSRYLLTFDMAGNPDGTKGVKELSLQLNGAGVQNFTFNTTGQSRTNMGWVTYSYIFVADSPTTTVGFKSLTTTAYGPALDNVTLAVIPAPAAALLAFFGLGIVGWVKRQMA